MTRSRHRSRSSSSSSSDDSRSHRKRDSSRRGRKHKKHRNRSREGRRKSENVEGANKVIGIFGLHPRTSEDEISEIFVKFGKIKRINLIYDTKTRISRGYAFIYYKHLRDAIDAKESSTGLEIEGRRIRVDYSVTTRPHERTPGLYKGKKVEKTPPPAPPAPQISKEDISASTSSDTNETVEKADNLTNETVESQPTVPTEAN